MQSICLFNSAGYDCVDVLKAVGSNIGRQSRVQLGCRLDAVNLQDGIAVRTKR